MKHRIKESFTTYNGLPKEVYILFGARVITCLGGFILPLLTLILSQKLGMSATKTGNFSALLIMSQGPCLLLGGKLIDAFGEKKILVLCHVLGSLFYLMCGFINNHTLMLIFIVIASDLYTAASPAYQAMVARLTTPENRKASYSLIYLGINIGMTVSPLIGGLLFKDYLQVLFILDAATTLLSTYLIALYVKLPKKSRQNDTDAADCVDSGKRVSTFQALKSVPVLLFFLLLLFVYDFTYIQWSFMLPLQFGELYKENGARFYSFLSVVNPVICTLFTPPLTRLTMKHHPLAVVAGGGLLYFGSYVLFAFAQSIPIFVVAGALYTFGEILVVINIGAFIADHSPSAHLGRMTAVRMFLQGTAGALGPLAMGHVISATNYRISWLLTAAIVFAGAMGMLILSRKETKGIIPAE
jgi:Arabinose efflux permease